MTDLFDRATMLSGDQEVLDDFHKRRRAFDAFVAHLPLFTCPSCGYPTLEERGGDDICRVCDWQDDNQDDAAADEIWGGPNAGLSLTESRLLIGRELRDLVAASQASLISSPDVVLAVLRRRDAELNAFAEQNIGPHTPISDPAWTQWADQRKTTLKYLLTQLRVVDEAG